MNQRTRDKIREAYLAGELRTETVDPDTGDVSLQRVAEVMRHHTSHKRMFEVTVEGGSSATCTEDHSLFRLGSSGVVPVVPVDLKVDDTLAVVRDGVLGGGVVVSVMEMPPCEVTYDLSVPGPENFVLSNGILAHNSYSIGGVSLDLDKSSKYESLKQNAEGQFDKLTEAKARVTKYIRGLTQPRFGIGVRSSFGPAVGRGILSPRNFL
jgi:hypothetical protein